MNKIFKWAAVAVGVVALAAIFLVPSGRSYARATVPAVAAVTVPQYTDNVVSSSTTGTTGTVPQYNGNNQQQFWNYMYGMMGGMMGGYWGNPGSNGQSSQDNYPYYGMMGGFGSYYPGQAGNGTQGQYPSPYYYGYSNNGGSVGGSVYGQ